MAKRKPDAIASALRNTIGCWVARLLGCSVTSRDTQQLSNRETEQLFLKQRVKRLARIVRRLDLACLVRGEIPHHFGLEERTFVAGVFVRHSSRNVLPALPCGGRIKGTAVAAGM